jgi:signal transduction histidine kinase
LSSVAQTVYDSAWFANYFDRVNTQREYRLPSAYDSLGIVKAIAEKINYQPAIAAYCIERATQLTAVQKNDSAIAFLKTAIVIGEKAQATREAGNAYMGLANIYQYSGNTLEAADNYLKAIHLLKELGRKRALIGLYRNLYTISARLQQKNGALQNMLTAVATDKKNESDLVRMINTKTNEDVGLQFPDQTLVKEVGANMIYVIFGNAKFLIRDFGTLATYGSMRDVNKIPRGSIDQIPNFPRNGSIVMELPGGDPRVYMVKDSTLFHIYNPEVLENYGGWDATYFLPIGSLKSFPKSDLKVTVDNASSIFNLNQEFDNMADSIEVQLKKNTALSNRLSQEVAKRNQVLRQRKTLLWLSAIGLVATLLIVVLLIRNARHRKKLNEQAMHALKAEEELQRKMLIEKERTRIANDMHDDLGAGLSTLRFLSEKLLQHKSGDDIRRDSEKIVGNSNELVQKMNELIWAMNEKNDTLEDLLFYTRAFAVDYLEQNGLSIEASLPEHIPSLMVNSEFRRNVFLTIKEALHNVVKHAKAQQVKLQMKISDQLVASITDDGKGMSEITSNHYGNGLKNMKRRMQSIGGDMVISNDNGTTVQLTVPLSNGQ